MTRKQIDQVPEEVNESEGSGNRPSFVFRRYIYTLYYGQITK